MSKKFQKIYAGFALIGAGAIIIALALACGGSGDGGSADLKGKIGEKITTGKFEITVNSVTPRYSVGGEFLQEKPGQGAVFIVVNFNYKNISKEPVSSFSVPKVKIIDPNNVAYEQAMGAAAAYASEVKLDKKIASDLNPGISQRDADVFEVAKEIWNKPGWKLRLDADKDIEITIK